MTSDHDALIIGGGQSGLAATHALHARGLRPVLLEEGDEPVGSWPHYYDSLTLFSPARYSALPGMGFPGDPDRYPHRDEVVDYLRRYAARLAGSGRVDIRTHHRVDHVARTERDGFEVTVEDGTVLRAPIVIAATGGFGRPHRPALAGLDEFTGTVLHAADYREPTRFAGQRVVVVGAANTAVQIGAELAAHAEVTLATRNPIRFLAQRPLGRDVHFWSRATGLDALPVGPFLREAPRQPVNDDGRYRRAVDSGRPDQRRMFTGLDGATITWSDGTREEVHTIILATGYRPNLDYLTESGALDQLGTPRHRCGLSTTHPGLGFVGLEWQRSFASATLRGVGRDARFVAARLVSSRARARVGSGRRRIGAGGDG